MRKFLSIVVLIFGVTVAYAQTLDSAIEDAAGEISGKLQQRSTVVVISFQSDSERLTNYVIDELNGKLANIGKVIAVERRQLNAIRSELNFNMSGDVSDESAQRIGRMLGSRYIIMGSIDLIGNQYRIRFRAITTETASIAHAFSQNIKNDTVLESLMGRTGSTVNFTPQERWSTSALNLVFGLGSFIIEKDKFGGGITAALEGVGTVLIIYSIAMFNTKHSAGTYRSEYDTLTKSYEAYPFFGGLGLYLGGAIFGIIRAQTYSRPGSQVAASPFDKLQLNLVSLESNKLAFQIGYKWEY